MNRVEPAKFTKQVFGESLVSFEDTSIPQGASVANSAEKLDNSPKESAENSTGSLQETYNYKPHPPEKLKDSTQRIRRRIKKRRDAKRNQVDSIAQRSEGEEEKLLPQQSHEELSDNRFTGSKLPPLSKDLSNVIESELNSDKKIKHVKTHTLNLKPLSPIKDSQDVADNFKAKQLLERGKHDVKRRPVKPLDPIDQVSRIDNINEQAKVFKVSHDLDLNKQASTINNNENDDDSDVENKSEKTLTSVSSNDLDSVTDSDSPDSPRTQFYPKAPSGTPPSHHRPHHYDHDHRSSLSLKSDKKDYPEQVERHSDSEAIRRGRNGNRQSGKEMWGKAKVVTLLPRVPAARARDRNSNFVNEELEKYLPERKLMVFIGTWNMHGEKVGWKLCHVLQSITFTCSNAYQ